MASTIQPPHRTRLREHGLTFRSDAGDGRAVKIGRHVLAALAFLVFVLLAGPAAYYGVRGWTLCEEALSEKSVDEMAAQVRSSVDFVETDEAPDVFFDAVVAAEDRRFYSHRGVDPVACVRALANDLKAGRIVEGGSTITQQLAKNQFFSQERTLERKAAEMFMAFEIESRLSKKEILELYVNSIYYGDGHYGVSAACMGYFGKAPSEMDDAEAILLAGLPNAPSAYSPSVDPELAEQRKAQVEEKMRAYGFLG